MIGTLNTRIGGSDEPNSRSELVFILTSPFKRLRAKRASRATRGTVLTPRMLWILDPGAGYRPN